MSAVFAARRKRRRTDIVTTMAQGVQPLVRNEVTQNSPDIQVSGLFAPQDARYRACPVSKCALVIKGSFVRSYSPPKQLNKKVTICARVQSLLGLKVVAVVPPVMPFSAAHRTALA